MTQEEGEFSQTFVSKVTESFGKILVFIFSREHNRTLPVSRVVPGEPFLFGVNQTVNVTSGAFSFSSGSN